MDYKTNILSEGVEAKMQLLPEINGLLFAPVDNGEKILFDYTQYFIENTFLTPVDYKVFMRMNKMHIEQIAEDSGIKTSEMFYQNTDGHILVTIELSYLFLMFVNKELFLYFNNIIREVLTRGYSFSDSFIFTFASERLPDDALNEIMDMRKKNEERVQQQSDAHFGI